MSRARVTIWTLFLATGFALATPPAAWGQETPLPKRNNAATNAVIGHRDNPRGGIPPEALPKAREDFKAFAKYYADVIAHPAVWRAAQEIKPDPLVPVIDGPQGILHDLDRFLIEPIPTSRQLNLEPTAYIREFGAAMDAALKPLIVGHPEVIVRVNAARVLAHVARTGAPAHFATVIPLIKSANTPTYVKHYMFQVAAALLAAQDPSDPRVRKHAADPKVIGELVQAIQDCINDPALLLVGYKPQTATPEQFPVIAMVRRQAVRALAQVKFVMIPGPDGRTPIYPSYTLVRVAMSDPALTPAPGPAEAAEAVIGLCNMAPVKFDADRAVRIKNFNSGVLVEAVTQALLTFASPRAADPLNHALPWRAYAIRLAEALHNWSRVFDPDFDPLRPSKYDPTQTPGAVTELVKFVIPNILAPMDKTDGTGKADTTAEIRVPRLQQRLSELRNNPQRKTTLFEGVPETSIDFAPPKK